MVWQQDIGTLWSDTGWSIHIYRRGCVVEGHRGVLVYSDSQIRIRCREGAVRIEGQSLAIASLDSDEVRIQGDIRLVCRE